MCLLILAAQIENNLVLVCANVPTLRALFRKPASITEVSGYSTGNVTKGSRDISLIRTFTIDEVERDDKGFDTRYYHGKGVEPRAYP